MKNIIFLVFFCVGCQSIGEIQPEYKTEYLHPQAGQLSIYKTNSETLFEVKNKFGIGKAKVILEKGSWPKKIVLRLYLNGLEGITISGSGQRLEKSDLQITENKINGITFFEIILPESLFQKGKEVYFSWVDFYR